MLIAREKTLLTGLTVALWRMVLQSGRPRFYAAHICSLKTRKERVEALEKVPAKIRSWVKFYVEDNYAKRNIQRARRNDKSIRSS